MTSKWRQNGSKRIIKSTFRVITIQFNVILMLSLLF